jgi:2,5-furandicarboxylate decarboxylase 1
VKSASKLAVRVDPGRRLWDVTKDKEKIDAALIIGAPPSVEFAASVRGSTFDKLEMAGSLQGSSVDLVKCKAVNCEVPALSQIVIEGVMDKRNMEPEGPFAEFTGYYSPPEPMPIFQVKKVTMRSDAVFRTVIGASAEHLTLNNVGREASLYDSLKRAVPGVVDVHLPPFGCGFIAFVSIRKEYVMMAKNSLLAVLSAHPVVKYAIVVDEDVNIHDEREVLWAMATRSGGDDDLVIVPRAFNHGLDPGSNDGFVTKLGIDATFPADKKEIFKKVEYMSLDRFNTPKS